MNSLCYSKYWTCYEHIFYFTFSPGKANLSISQWFGDVSDIFHLWMHGKPEINVLRHIYGETMKSWDQHKASKLYLLGINQRLALHIIESLCSTIITHITLHCEVVYVSGEMRLACHTKYIPVFGLIRYKGDETFLTKWCNVNVLNTKGYACID